MSHERKRSKDFMDNFFISFDLIFEDALCGRRLMINNVLNGIETFEKQYDMVLLNNMKGIALFMGDVDSHIASLIRKA